MKMNAANLSLSKLKSELTEKDTQIIALEKALNEAKKDLDAGFRDQKQ
jgi:chromosome segregation ATPase